MVEVAGLQPHHIAGDVEYARRYPVRPETVDQPTVAVLPEYAAEPERRANEDQVIELVEVPLVEQELVERLMLARELERQLGLADVKVPRDEEAQRHHHGRGDGDPIWHAVHFMQDVVALGELQRVAE